MDEATMRMFWLVRSFDVTGISGIGTVAEGVEFSDGTVVLRWLTKPPSEETEWMPPRIQGTTVIHPSIVNVINLHGHDGNTRLVWEKPSEARNG